MTTNHIAVPALVFNGVEIHNRNEMLCLTDMWRAAGAVEAKRPSNWARKEGAEFIEHVSMILNVPHGHIQTQRGGSGAGRGATFAHWQIGLAYAKYLSPEFHMWCNTVVRERMEGKPAPALPAEALEEITRTFGIMRKTIHKVTEMEKVVNTLPALAQAVSALTAIVHPGVPGKWRPGKTAGEILTAAGIVNPPKNVAKWLGNRLEAAGCRVEGKSTSGLTYARMFDPDKSEAWLKNGGKFAVEKKIAERNGQGALALTGHRRPAPLPTIPPDMDNEGIGAIIFEGEPVYFDIRVKKLEPNTRYVVVNVKGDVLVDIPHCSMAGHGGSMGPRGVLTSPRMEAVAGRHDPMPVQWEAVILGKVIERQNVVRIPIAH